MMVLYVVGACAATLVAFTLFFRVWSEAARWLRKRGLPAVLGTLALVAGCGDGSSAQIDGWGSLTCEADGGGSTCPSDFLPVTCPGRSQPTITADSGVATCGYEGHGLFCCSEVIPCQPDPECAGCAAVDRIMCQDGNGIDCSAWCCP